MLVMGFDPGSISFGIGILKKEQNRMVYLHSEQITLQDEDFNAKMKRLWQRLNTLYEEFPIHTAAIEEGFLGKNVQSMNTLAKVRGVVLASLIHRNIELFNYSPRQIKQALTGNGNATKAQVAIMIQTLLNKKTQKMGADESDALAVAYCHALWYK